MKVIFEVPNENFDKIVDVTSGMALLSESASFCHNPPPSAGTESRVNAPF